MSPVAEQLAFDLELDKPVDKGFPTMQTPENSGLCSRCGRKLKGHYSRCHGAVSSGVWFAWCDTCTEAK